MSYCKTQEKDEKLIWEKRISPTKKKDSLLTIWVFSASVLCNYVLKYRQFILF